MSADRAIECRLQCREVSRFFGHFAALRDISFALTRGTLTALFGPNGAGKSTLLLILAGAMHPSLGKVSIEGFPINSPAARRRVGLLSHQSFLHPSLTVGENLHYFATLYGLEPEPATRQALALVRGEHLHELRVAQLSQGMRQKAALARALLHAPGVLLLDEPFASLDRETVAQLRSTLRSLRDGGLTLMVTTHNEELLADLADDALTLDRGRLVAQHA